MSEQKLKLGQKGAIRKIAKELTDIRKSPLSPKVHDIVRENHERTGRQDKK